jgi:predicted ATPase
MNESYQEALKEAFALAPHNKVILQTIEVRQTGVQASIYMVQARQSWVAFDENDTLRTFEPVGFQFSLPPSNEEGFRSLNIAIDNIGRRVSDFVNTAKSENVPVEMWYRPYLSDDNTAPQMIPPLVLYLKELQITTHQVTGKATFMDVVNRKFPIELYTRARFPSLG